MTYDKTRKAVILHGGVLREGTVHRAVNRTWILEDDREWREICVTPALPALHAPGFAYDPLHEQLMLVGGSMTDDFKTPSDAVWTCSTTAVDATWIPQPPLPRGVIAAQLVHDTGRGSMVLVGGVDAAGEYSRDSLATTALQTWVPLPVDTPAAMGGSATNVTYDDRDERILALKNYARAFGAGHEPVNELWQLPKNAGHWSLVCAPCLNTPRSEAALVHLGASTSTFVIGGHEGNTDLAGSWILDNGELVQSHDDPPARDRAGVTYNVERDQVVVYGGNGPGCHGEGANCNTTWVLELE
jgi:hypothetical protein